jgi:hypothetical protein
LNSLPLSFFFISSTFLGVSPGVFFLLSCMYTHTHVYLYYIHPPSPFALIPPPSCGTMPPPD